MPHLRRSNISITKERICIEAETPSLPKNATKRTTKNKKRKLDDEFSPQSSATKYHVTRNTKATKVVYNETRRSTRKTKNLPTSNGNNIVSTNGAKKQKRMENPNNVQQKGGHGACHNDDENCSENMELDISNAKKGVNNMPDVSKGDSVKQQLSNNTTATVTEHDKIQEGDGYQRKYFRLLEAMECLQKQFLASQQDFEDHITANDAFVGELKNSLEEKNKQVLGAQHEMELCKTRNSELEDLNLSRSKEIQHLNTKVETMMKTAKSVVETEKNEEQSLKLHLTEQQDILDCYKILTGLSLQKNCPVTADENQSAYQSFTCSIKTVEGKDLQFQLSHDREFAELGYKPHECYSPETTEKICAFPTYLQSQIFFGNEQAPNFLIRLLQAAREPKK